MSMRFGADKERTNVINGGKKDETDEVNVNDGPGPTSG